MSNCISIETRSLLDAFARVLIRCFLFCLIILLWWAAIFLILGDLAHQIHSTMFKLSWHEFVLVNYCGIGLLKILSFVLFLFPYIAIRLVLRQTNVLT